MQRCGGNYDMNQVLKSAKFETLTKRGNKRFKINIKRIKAPAKYLYLCFENLMKFNRSARSNFIKASKCTITYQMIDIVLTVQCC